MSNVAHLAKNIDSLSLVLPPRKLWWFLDNITYAFLLFNWERCKILEIRKLYCSKTALGWGQGCFSNGFGSWRCRISVFVVQGSKSDNRDNSGLKIDIFLSRMGICKWGVISTFFLSPYLWYPCNRMPKIN